MTGRKRHIRILAAQVLWCLVAHNATAIVAPLSTSFEGDLRPVKIVDPRTTGRVSGKLPVEWQDNSSWADVDVTYSAAPHQGIAGSQALKIEIRKAVKGRVQLINRSIAPQSGQLVRLSLAVRSAKRMSAEILFRQAGTPYKAYWRRSLECTARWRTYTYEVPIRFSDPDCYLMLAFGHPGVVYLDNVRAEVRSLDDWAAARVPQRPNLLPNSRFPLGLTNGWCISHRGRMLNTAQADRHWPGPSGQPSLRVKANFEKAILYSPPFAVVPGKELCLSFQASCDEPKTPISVRVPGAKQTADFILERRWQRFTLRFSPDVKSGGNVMLAFSTPGTVWLDNVQVERGQLPSPPFAESPELHVRSRNFMGIQTVTEKVVDSGVVPPFRLLGTLLGKAPKGAEVHLTETDAFGRVRDFTPIPADRLQGRVVELPIPARPASPMGSFRITLELFGADGKALPVVSETIVHRLYKPYRFGKLTPESPFGVHVSPTERQCRMAALLGFKWVRVHDAASWLTKWNYIEPEKGKWLWHDAEIDRYRRYGLSVLGMLGTAPPWASVRPANGAGGYWEGYYVPKDLAAWKKYVYTTVRHYRKTVQTWEVWNEPYGGFFRAGEKDGKPIHGTAEQYMDLLKAAYREAHRANSGVTVLGPCTTPASWSRECLKLNLLDTIDGFSYHQYTGTMLGYPGDAKERELTEAVRIQGKFGKPKPVWCTEGGFGGNAMLHFYDSKLIPVEPTLDPADSAAGVVRYYVAELAGGSTRFFLYTMHGYGTFLRKNWSVLSADGSVHPLGAAVSNLAHRLEGARFSRRVEVQPGLFAYVFKRSRRGGVIVLLPRDETPMNLQVWVDGAAYDMMGNPMRFPISITNLPLFLTWRGSEEVAVQALKTPMAWKASASGAGHDGK